MRVFKDHYSRILSLIIVTSLMLLGCQRPVDTTIYRTHLALLASLYIVHLNAHQGQPPQDEIAFKQFISERGGRLLELSETADLESLFISERNGQPLVLQYRSSPPSQMPYDVVGFERAGVVGTRHVAFRDGTLREISDNEFELLLGRTTASAQTQR